MGERRTGEADMSRKRADNAARTDVPELGGAVVAVCQQSVPVRRERGILEPHAADREQSSRAARPHAPQVYPAVATGGGDEAAVWAESDTPHSAVAPTEDR